MKKVVTEAELEEYIARELMEMSGAKPEDDSVVSLPPTVNTPCGEVVVSQDWLDEPTREIPAAQAEVLIRRCHALAPDIAKARPASGTRERIIPPPLPLWARNHG